MVRLENLGGKKTRITFFGTGSTIPSPARAHPSFAITYLGESLLFDCGEGTQTKIQETGVNPMRISKIFITHFHPDHFLGLPGLLSSMELMGRSLTLEIFAPAGAEKKLKKLVELSSGGKLKYPVKYVSVSGTRKPNEIVSEARYSVFSCKTAHSVPSLAFSFVENDSFHLIPEKVPQKLKAKCKGNEWMSKIKPPKKCDRVPEYFSVEIGLKITYSGDTKYTSPLVALAQNSDVLIHEATFPEEKPEKAEEYCHSVPATAARVALESGSKMLVLTHFSRRITDFSAQEEAAKRRFPNTLCAKDGMVLDV